MKTNQILSIVAIVIVASGASFFAGTKYQQSKTSSTSFDRPALNGQGQGIGRVNSDGSVARNRGQAPGFRQTIGEITSVDDKSITVKLADGSSKIVLLSDSTVFSQSNSASKSDLKVGTKIMVNGDTNTDGSVTSRNIEVNPAFATITPTVKQ